ncbi:MAG: hypothetical protein PUC59_09090 [Firmicutes bacterium]|nr:hypothetical protein [Bacillota bacterium]
MNRAGSVALCGTISALCLVCMFLTGVIPFATFALPALAGVLLIVIVIEQGKRWALLAYLVVSLLAFILAADLEAKLMFACFFGYYPILKALFEGMRRPRFAFCLKLAVFNAAVIAVYFVLSALGGLLPDEFQIFGKSLPLLFLIAGNVIFVLYDYALSCLAATYVRRLQPKLRRLFRI